MDYEFGRALKNQAEDVLALYKSVIGTEFCVWNHEYPSAEEADRDIETGNLYVLTDGVKIIGAISVVPENEMDHFDCWQCNDGTAREIARVVVAPECRGRNLAQVMVESIIPVLKSSGCRAVHLSVERHHIPAYRTYEKLGFAVAGEAEMYGGSYYLMEKQI